MTTTVRLEEATRDRLNRLKGVFNVSNVDEVIQQLLFRLGYNELFFQRLDTLKAFAGDEKTE